MKKNPKEVLRLQDVSKVYQMGTEKVRALDHANLVPSHSPAVCAATRLAWSSRARILILRSMPKLTTMAGWDQSNGSNGRSSDVSTGRI